MLPREISPSLPRRAAVIRVLLTALLGSQAICGAAIAEDWPQWRGPSRDGKSTETGLLATWPAEGPPLAWRAEGVGLGYSSLAVRGDRIFTLGDQGENQFVLAVDAGNGEVLWRTAIGPSWDHKFVGARSTPTLDGDHVYALSTEGVLVCVRQSDGEISWQRNLVEDFGARLMTTDSGYSWKFSESPLVDGDKVVVTPGVDEALLVALDKSSGRELWRTRAPVVATGGDDGETGGKKAEMAFPGFREYGLDGAGYSSVVVSHAAGVRQYVQLVGRGVVGVDAESGRLLWHYGRVANQVANIATPLVQGDLVFVSTGYGTGSALVEIRGTDGGLEAVERYFLAADTMQNHHGGLILHRDHVFTGTGHNKGFPLSVQLADGKVAWGPIRNKGKSSAAIVYADGRLYFRYQDGLMVLIEATPDGYEEHGSFAIPGADQFSWSQPVIANGRLYLREQNQLFAYDIRAPKAQGTAATSP